MAAYAYWLDFIRRVGATCAAHADKLDQAGLERMKQALDSVATYLHEEDERPLLVHQVAVALREVQDVLPPSDPLAVRLAELDTVLMRARDAQVRLRMEHGLEP